MIYNYTIIFECTIVIFVVSNLLSDKPQLVTD